MYLCGRASAYKTSLSTPQFLLKCLYEARNVSSHVFVCWGIDFTSTIFCCIFLSFILSSIMINKLKQCWSITTSLCQIRSLFHELKLKLITNQYRVLIVIVIRPSSGIMSVQIIVLFWFGLFVLLCFGLVYLFVLLCFCFVFGFVCFCFCGLFYFL